MVLRFSLFAIILFIISCNNIERNNPEDQYSINYRGNQLLNPSSHSVSSSSSSSITTSGNSSVVSSSSSRASSSSVVSSSSSKVSSSSVTPSFSSSSAILCNGIKYNFDTEFCYDNIVYNKCGDVSNGATYNPTTEQCCGNNKYILSTQFCYNSSKVGDFCGKNPQKSYNPDLYECRPNINPNGIYLKEKVIDYNAKEYNAVLIGEQIWMAENLNNTASGGVCYDGQESNCTKYGRLYDYASATANMACPIGGKWHLPTSAEWDKLYSYVNEINGAGSASNHLKATSGWTTSNGTTANGIDTYGFTALPGGYAIPGAASSFSDIGRNSCWWASPTSAGGKNTNRGISGSHCWDGGGVTTSFLFSVRCVRD